MRNHSYVNEEKFLEFIQLPLDTTVVMMNLLKFKDYVPETGLSGEDSYKVYLKEATPYFRLANAEVLFMGKPKTMLIGPEDEDLWDKVLIIRYHTISSFLGMINVEGFPKHLRTQALEDSRLIHCE